MSKQIQVFPDYQTKLGFKIRFEKYVTLRQLYQETLQSNIDSLFTKHNERHYTKVIFVFRASYQDQSWKQKIELFSLRKTFLDLFNFQHAIRKNYKQIPKFPLAKDDEDKLDPYLLQIFVDFLGTFIKSVYEFAFEDPLLSNFVNLFPQKIGHGIIFGQYPLLKRSGGRYNETSCLKECYHYLLPCSRSWRHRYFTVTDNGIFYSQKSKTFDIKDILLYCFKFTIYYGILRTGRELGIVLESSTRRLKLEAEEFHVLILFIVAIKEALKMSPFSDEKREKSEKYGSFAPIRENCSSRFYIDGKGYFQDLCEQLKKAKKYVYITGWMITPYFMLKRPNELLKREYRLDGILEELAKRNVKIYIVLYQEPKIAINNDSEFVKKYLEEIGGNNIKVIRHPNYIVIPFLWSHHQKIVLIDQKVAFLGGLDICYGRWDTQNHPLYNPDTESFWEGADYCNLRIRDIYKPRDYMMSNLTLSEPKMPWHDVAIQIQGPSVNDIARHFTNYWNFVNFQTKIDNDRQLLNMSGFKNVNKLSRFAAAKNFFKKISFLKKTTKIEPVIEMTEKPLNSSKKGISQEPRQKSIVIKKKQRGLSPDLTVTSPGLKTPMGVRKRSITYQERESIDSNRSMPSSSRSSTLTRRKQSLQEEYYDRYIKKEENQQNNFHKLLKYPIKLLGLLKDAEAEEKLLISNEGWSNHNGKHTHTVLRSASTWSSGLSETELSIHQAYLSLIRDSKRFIYIENQFFIARQNLVVDELAKRVILAFEQKQQFKVMIFIPLLPGFEGDVRENNSTVMRIQLHLQYETICRSNTSFFSLLIDAHMKPEDIEIYVKFFSLRQHGVINDQPVTEILYIHSKLMIVDDEKMIIGSANINDRSLLGDRDSEIAVLIEENKKMPLDNSGQVNYFKDIKSFRVSLVKQHFGVDESLAQNIYDEVVWKQLKFIAKRNTQIYRYVFGCYPDDKMKKFSDIDMVEKQTIPQRANRYKEEKGNFIGHAVELPLHFLEEENLEIQLSQKEIILPDFFFT